MRRCIAILLVLVALMPAMPAGEAPIPVVRDQLEGSPWYDSTADSWKRVELPQDDDDRGYDQGEGGDGIPGFAYLMYALVILAIGLIATQLWRLRGAGRGAGDAGIGGVSPVRFSSLPFAVPDGDGDPESAFRAACAAGDWTRAVVWLYAWQLLRLDGAGVVRLLPGKTNRGYLREAETLPSAGAALGETILVFERAYFGHQPATREEVERLDGQHRLLLAALPTLDQVAS